MHYANGAPKNEVMDEVVNAVNRVVRAVFDDVMEATWLDQTTCALGGITPLKLMATYGNTGIAAKLLHKQLDNQTLEGALMAAAEHGQYEMVRLLLQQVKSASGLDSNTAARSYIATKFRDHLQRTPFQYAVINGHIEVARDLCCAEAVASRDFMDRDAVHLVAMAKYPEPLFYLISPFIKKPPNMAEGGASRTGSSAGQTIDIDRGDRMGWTAVHIAAAASKTSAAYIKFLRRHGARLDLRTCAGNGEWTPLDIAVKHCNMARIRQPHFPPRQHVRIGTANR